MKNDDFMGVNFFNTEIPWDFTDLSNTYGDTLVIFSEDINGNQQFLIWWFYPGPTHRWYPQKWLG